VEVDTGLDVGFVAGVLGDVAARHSRGGVDVVRMSLGMVVRKLRMGLRDRSTKRELLMGPGGSMAGWLLKMPLIVMSSLMKKC